MKPEYDECPVCDADFRNSEAHIEEHPWAFAPNSKQFRLGYCSNCHNRLY
jgi:hypothetical protein